MNKKKILTLVLIGILFSNVLGVTALASEEKITYAKEAVYDLEKGGSQTFVVYNENGEREYIVVEEISSNSKMANGDYQVSYTSTGSWKAGFKVTISNNKITKAFSPSCVAIVGRISGSSLVRNSDIRATYSFLHTVGTAPLSTGVKAVISNNQLVVSKL